MSEKKLDLIIEKLNTLETQVGELRSRIDSKFTTVNGRLKTIEADMLKVLKCVDHENADFDPMKGVPLPKKTKAFAR